MNLKKTGKTIPRLLKQRVSNTPEAIAYMEKDASGTWNGITWKQFYDQVISLSTGLVNYGLDPGDQIGVLMPNSVLWEVVHHATAHAGCVVVGLDVNDPPERIGQIAGISDIKALVVQRSGNLEGLPPELLTSVKLILVIEDTDAWEAFDRMATLQDLMVEPDINVLPQIEETARATLLFTSGTTGTPKAIPYDHDQIIAAVEAITRQIQDVPQQAPGACWLPLSNPFQRIINLCSVQENWRSFMVPDPVTIISEAEEIKPQFFAAVPRFYEKVYEGIVKKVNGLPFPVKGVFRLAMTIGMTYRSVERRGQQVPGWLELSYRLACNVALNRLRGLLGGNISCFISGSAPMTRDLLNRFDAIGWLILESYGVSENIVPMSMNTPSDFRLGSVGRPLPENSIRIADDGEVLVRSIGVTRNGGSLTEDGYLKTGDVGTIDDHGYLRLSGRKADSFKLSTGRKIAPLMTESVLKEIDEVEHAVVGGANRKYVVALLNISDDTWQELLTRFHSEADVRNYLKHRINKVCSGLPNYCCPVDFDVIRDPFTVETGELTVNLKVRRNHVLEKYENLLDDLYQSSAVTPEKKGTVSETRLVLNQNV